MPLIPIIFGVAALTLSPEESTFFHQHKPAGLILFKRNCASPDQVKKLIDDFKIATENPDAHILIDQEGGRVARLKNHPDWPLFPAQAHFGDLYTHDPDQAYTAAEQNSFQIGQMLKSLGITINCAPVLDVRFPETHDAIGDRSFGPDPIMVGKLADASIRGYLRAGITPVLKHIPGQGRAAVDSHLELPKVEATLADLRAIDFVPFTFISAQDYAHKICAMVAHVNYTGIEEGIPATQSSHIIHAVIKEEIGFQGLIMSDDITMKALKGDYTERTKKLRAAGCDLILHCNGVMDEMLQVAAAFI